MIASRYSRRLDRSHPMNTVKANSFRPMSRAMRIGWKTAQAVSLVATVVLLLGLVLRPQTTLWLMWNLLIPILPATFVISPLLWRGACPLATLNEWSSGRLGARQMAGGLLARSHALGLILLFLLVPARRFLFNENGSALAVTIVMVVLMAVVLGALFSRRAGFCNAICPILPVEKLYGQHPLLALPSPRCDQCTLCISKGCLDVSATKSIAHGVGGMGSRYGWLMSAYGIFAAAFPGFIVGYYTLDNVPWTAAPQVYLWMTFCCAASLVTTMSVVRLFDLSSRISLTFLAAVSVTLYYFWAVPVIAEVLFLPRAGIYVLWAAVLVLVGVWLRQAWPHLRSTESQRTRSP